MNKVLNEVKKYVNQIINSQLYVILVGVILFVKMMLFYKYSIYQGRNVDSSIISKTFITSMSIMTIFLVFKNKCRFWLTTIFNFVCSIVMFGDELYYSYSSSILSIAQIGNLQYSEQIIASIGDLLKFSQLLYFFDIIVILLLTFFRFLKIEKNRNFEWKPFLIYFIMISLVYSTTVKTYVVEAKNYKYNKKMQLEVGTLYTAHYLDIYSTLNLKKLSKYKKIDDMMSAYNKIKNSYYEKYNEDNYNLFGVAKDMNVIVIQLESIQDYVVNKTIDGKEITPNINKFLNENIRFNNMISQSYTTTADSEHSVINSLYPLENGMAFAQYSNNEYNDLFSLYKKCNYKTMYVHGNVGSFWNRKNVYSHLDIDNLCFIDSFDSNSELINEWISDESLYRQTFDKIKNIENPFLVDIISASSHTAFDLPGLDDKYSKVSIDVGQYKNTYFGNYLEAVNYADYAFGLFIEMLKNEGIYDNTMIIIYGDHYGVQMYNDEMLDFISSQDHKLNNIETELNYVKVICGLHIPNVEGFMVDKVVSKLDIKPTLCYLSGIEDEFSLGQNMFKNKDFVCLDNGIIVCNKYYYNGNWYDIENGNSIDKNLVDEQLKNYFNYCEYCMDEELAISNSIIVHNLLKNNHK